MIIFAFIMLFVVAVAGIFYLLTRFHKFYIVEKLSGGKKWRGWLIAGIPTAGVIAFFLLNTVTATVFTLHLMVFWFLCDLVSMIIRKCSKKTWKYYIQGIVALVITGIYLSVGMYYGYHVFETDYAIETSKNIGMDNLRVALIADSHIGSTFDGEGFANHMKEIEKTNPDVLVITGDYVDDDSSYADLKVACQALGQMKLKYGVYYVFGNHDKGYFDTRDFTEVQLREELTKNNVKILEDETALLGENIYLIGRQDRSETNRKSMEDLTAGLDDAKYQIVLDHQPNDYDAEKAADVDLVLSGHTHGGQMIPVGYLGEWSGANDKTYGLEKEGNTNFLVTSGISDWAIPFKTGTISEFVVIDIKGK